ALRAHGSVTRSCRQILDLKPVAGETPAEVDLSEPRSVRQVLVCKALALNDSPQARVGDAAGEIGRERKRSCQGLIGHAREGKQRPGRTVVADATSQLRSHQALGPGARTGTERPKRRRHSPDDSAPQAEDGARLTTIRQKVAYEVDVDRIADGS